MKIQSARLGEVTIDPERIVTFTDGIIGFPGVEKFAELPVTEGSPLTLLQAVEDPKLGFILIDPALFVADYRAEVTREDRRAVGFAEGDELDVRVIVTLPEDPYQMTANLQGPLVFNPRTRLARQVVNNSGDYGTKHRVLADPAA